MSKPAFQLYHLSVALDNLLDRLDDFANPIPSEEFDRLVKEIATDQTALFDELRHAAINLKAQKEAAKAEAQRLTEMAKLSETKEERMKKFLFEAMELSGLKKVAFPDGGYLRIQANSKPTVNFVGEAEALPEGFKRTKITYSLDADSVLQAVEMGTPLPEGITVVKGSHLRLA